MHDKDPKGTNSPVADKDGLEREIEALREPWSALRADEPPALLDQAVRNASRRALERGRRPGRRLRWLGGLATAAVAVLAISLLYLQPDVPRQVAPGGDGFRLDEAPPAQQRKGRAEQAPKREHITARSAPVAEEADAAAAPAPAAASVAVAEEAEPSRDAAGEFPDPEAWIAEMLELQQRGESALLASELERFRAAYPDHPLPTELAD